MPLPACPPAWLPSLRFYLRTLQRLLLHWPRYQQPTNTIAACCQSLRSPTRASCSLSNGTATQSKRCKTILPLAHGQSTPTALYHTAPSYLCLALTKPLSACRLAGSSLFYPHCHLFHWISYPFDPTYSECALRSLLVICRSHPQLAIAHVLPGLLQPMLTFAQSPATLPPPTSVASSLSAVIATSIAHPMLLQHSLPRLLSAVHSQLDGTPHSAHRDIQYTISDADSAVGRSARDRPTCARIA